MKKTLCVAFSVLALSLFPACQGVDAAGGGGAEAMEQPVETAVGTYALDAQSLMKQMMGDMPTAEGDAGAQMLAAMQKAMEGMSGTIELKADNTCAMSMTMMGREQSVEGIWSREGDQVTITAQQEGEEDDARVATLANGVLSVTEEQNGKSMTMRFVRSK